MLETLFRKKQFNLELRCRLAVYIDLLTLFISFWVDN